MLIIKNIFILFIFTFCIFFYLKKKNPIDSSPITSCYTNIYKNYNNYNYKNNQIINYNKNSSYRLKVAICIIVKQENIYIKEFVNYYNKLGIKKIFIYDNNEINGENLKDILYPEISKNIIKIINFRGFYKPQKYAYNDCYKKNKNDYDWFAFFDTDEYLYIENYTNINQFLSLSKFKNCSSILFNWKYYGDNNYLYYEPKPIQERFLKPIIYTNQLKNNLYFYSAGKSIIRTGLNISWGHFPHFLNNSFICRPDGTITKQPLENPQFSFAYIKHYATKSTEEYLIKLFKGTVNSNMTLDKDNILFWLRNYYFLLNKISRKKLLFIKRILKFKFKK